MRHPIVIVTCAIAALATVAAGRSMTAALTSTGPCGGSAAWFGGVRRVPLAPYGQWDIPLQPVSYADVNGDGTAEYFSNRGIGSWYFANGEPPCCGPDVVFGVLERSVIAPGQGGAPEHIQCGALDNVVAWGQAQSFVAQNFSNIRDAYALGIDDPQSRYTGWRDCDLDGDLDLVIHVRIVFLNGIQSTVPLYYENIGFEHSGNLAADINQDGQVDGKDLATVIAQWTGG